MIRNLVLTISYDGTNYAGWQVQPGQRTIQGVIEEALKVVLAERCCINGAGRTDAGVHALGQVAHVRTSSRIPAANLRMALNSLLDKDIAVQDARDASPDFHARKDASAKCYTYRIYRGKTRDPFLWPYTWFLPEDLDLEMIRASLHILRGEHDFSAFSVADRENPNGVRMLKEARLIEDAPLLRLEFLGTGFLRKQVRRMVGTLIDVGRGRFTPERLSEILLSRDPTQAGPSAPPQGLFLEKVFYGVSP